MFNHRVQTFLDDDMKKWLDKIVSRNKTTPAQYIRDVLVKEYLLSEKK